MSTQTKVALLGLGTMGVGMAGRLLQAGFALTVYNRRAEKAEALVTQGAAAAPTPASAAAEADIVLAMVADDPASRQVWLGDHGALAGMRPGAIAVECSTLSPPWVRELAAAAARCECAFLDAPVTGSKPQANTGQLLFLVGGPAEALAAIRPVLAAMGRDVVHVGPVGSGALIKLINNFLCGVQAASVAEALALIERSGLDVEKALSVLISGAPGSPMVKTVAARMTARDYTPNFSLNLMGKDLAYAMDEARRHDLRLATAAGARHVLEEAIRAGHGEQDFSAAIEPLRRRRESAGQ